MGTAVLSGGQVFSNTANEGGGAQVETGTLTLNGGSSRATQPGPMAAECT